ncbi:MAG: endonuclease/exonuclease/phosphatase family protein [Candidatus Riflebacteria bacterium]|nr:endonuclease/exonuclease/phosphatase family protein [Candidatus Riflebacteria bacterium]
MCIKKDDSRTPNDTKAGSESHFILRLFWTLFNISVMGVLSGFVSPYWWAFEVLSSFRAQYAFYIGLGFIFAIMNKRTIMALFCSVLFVFNSYTLIPYYFFNETELNFSGRLKISGINVHTANKRFDLVLQYINEKKPDIVLLTEISLEWLNNLKPLEKEYPYFISKPQLDNFGIALFSKIPPKKLEIFYFVPELPSVLMSFLAASETVTLIGTHLLPPRNYDYSIGRNLQMEKITTFLTQIEGKKILTGDLNTPPWVDRFQKLLLESKMKDSSLGRGIQPTWPTNSWWLFGIPIDHCLVSPDFKIISRVVGPYVGSDHYPVYVELGIPEKPR